MVLIFYYLTGNGHPQTSALSSGFGGKECVEKLFFDLFSHAFTVIINFDSQFSVSGTDLDGDSRVEGLVIKFLCLMPYSVACIIHNVENGAAEVLWYY